MLVTVRSTRMMFVSGGARAVLFKASLTTRLKASPARPNGATWLRTGTVKAKSVCVFPAVVLLLLCIHHPIPEHHKPSPS